MSQYYEKIQQHPFINSLDIYKSSIADIDDIDNLSSDEIEIINRIKTVVSFSESRFQNTDPILIPINSLNNLNSAINSINTEINNFKASRNIAHLNNANNSIDNMLIHISNICMPLSNNDLENLRESIISFRKSIGQQLRHVESEFNEMQTLSDNMKKKSDEINQTLENQKNEIKQIIDKYNNDFETSRNERDNTYKKHFDDFKIIINNDFEDLKMNFDEFAKKITDEFSNTKNLYKKEVDSFISSLEHLKKQAENIVGVIGNTGIVGGFQQFANKERNSALFWKIIAFLSFSGLIIFGILSFRLTVGSEFNWGILGARLFAASTFGILAAYAARLADKHDFSEKLNRKMELELASIDPYIVNLPEDLKNEIKKQLSDKLFGQYDVLKFNKEEKVSKNSIDLVKSTLEILNEAIKKFK